MAGSAGVRRLATALASRQTPDFEAWEALLLQIERVAEDVGRQVEQWLCGEQAQLLHAGTSTSPKLPARGQGFLMLKSGKTSCCEIRVYLVTIDHRSLIVAIVSLRSSAWDCGYQRLKCPVV